MTEEERLRQLRSFVSVVPEGWRSITSDVARLNTSGAPGVFARIFVCGDLRLSAVTLPADPLRISVSRIDGQITMTDVHRICAEWFPGLVVEAFAPLDGIVFLHVEVPQGSAEA